MPQVTGIGGVFFKSKGDPAALVAWYLKHLGMPVADFDGAILKWPEDRADDKGLTVLQRSVAVNNLQPLNGGMRYVDLTTGRSVVHDDGGVQILAD